MGNINVINNNFSEKEEIIYNDLIKDGVDIIKNDIKIKELSNGIIAISKNNELYTYKTIKGNEIRTYLNVKGGLLDDKLFYSMIKYTGYDYENGKLYINNKEISIFSLEYFNIIEETSFYIDSQTRSEYIRRAEKWDGFLEKETIENLVIYNNIKLKEFLYLRQEGLVNDELYKKYLPQVVDNLLEQCADTRYDVFKGEKLVFSVKIEGGKLLADYKSAQDINEEEIKYYFEKGFISAEIAKNAIGIIEIRIKKDNEKDSIEDTVKSDLNSTRDSIK